LPILGNIIIGVADDKSFVDVQDIGALKQLISNASTKKYPTDIYHH